MSQQNIYDKETFFEAYRKLRQQPSNANDLLETPALYAMLPDLKGKEVLDLGCGFGNHCREYVNRGAARVVGLDISRRMLEEAREWNADPAVTYIRMAMEDLSRLPGVFDVVTSSLAFHYVEDFGTLIRDVYLKLKPGGTLLFSQENPICTARHDRPQTSGVQPSGKVILNFSSYGIEGEKENTWFEERVVKYHRTFSNVVNTLCDAGFRIERMSEPVPTEEELERHPEYRYMLHKPNFLLVLARK